MKQLDVQIMGQSYLLGCPEGGETRLLDAVEKVDAAMCKIRDVGKIKARDRIAVLAALNLAFELSEMEAHALKTSRTAAPAPAAQALPASPAAAKNGAQGGANTDASHPQFAALLQRLDNALGVDGRLL